MKTIITTILFGITFLSYSQNCQWAQREGGSNNDYGRDIIADKDGNTYSVGDFIGTITTGCGALSSAGIQDIYIQKRDKNGNCIWAISEGSTGQDGGFGVTLDTTGYIYVTGTFSGTVQFPTDTITSNGFLDMFLAKYDTSGTCIWARHLGGVPQSLFWGEYGNQVTIDVNGDVLVYAHTNFKAAIYKYDANGNYVWDTEIAGNGTIFATGITTDSNADVYVSLYNLSGSLTYFDCDTLAANSNVAPHVAKYDMNGNCVWAMQLGAGNTVVTGYVHDIESDANDGIYIAGSIQFDQDFGCGNTIAGGGLDAFIKKIDTNGNCLWSERTGGVNHEEAQGISIYDSIIHITGYFRGSASYFPNDTLVAVGNFTSGFVAQWDTAGNGHWGNEAGNGNNHCEMRRISTDAYGNAYITGWALANPVTFQCASLTGSGYDAIFARYSPPCQPPTAMFNNDTACLGNTTTFNDASDQGSAPLVSWGWDFDGDTVPDATGPSTTHTFGTAGLYVVILIVENDCGDIDTVEQQVLVNDLPAPDLGADTAGCLGNVFTLDPGNFITYSWENNATTQTIDITTSDTTWVQVVDSNGCAAVDSIIVTIHPLPNPDLGADTAFCAGDSVELDAGTFNAYSWNTTETTQTIHASSAGIFFVTVTDANSCEEVDSITVSENPLPTPNLGPDSTICDDEIITLDPGTYNDYFWQDATTTSTFSVDGNALGVGTHTFHVTVTDANGCENSDTIVVMVEVCSGVPEYGNQITTKVYPNPASDLLNVEVNSNKLFYAQVVNILGEEVAVFAINNGRATWNVGHTNPGIYLLKITNNRRETISVTKLTVR